MLRKEKLLSTKGAAYNCNRVLFYVAPSELEFLQHSFSIGLRPMLIYVAPLVLVRNISYKFKLYKNFPLPQIIIILNRYLNHKKRRNKY